MSRVIHKLPAHRISVKNQGNEKIDSSMGRQTLKKSTGIVSSLRWYLFYDVTNAGLNIACFNRDFINLWKQTEFLKLRESSFLIIDNEIKKIYDFDAEATINGRLSK